MSSAAAEAFRRWVREDAPALPIARFRMAFGAIWLAYDILDLAYSGTARIHDWIAAAAPSGLVGLQLGLIACEILMVVGAPLGLVMPATALAAVLRAVEWHEYLRLNDFAYFAVTAVILAHARPRGGLFRRVPPDERIPRWPRDVLVLQAAWIYFATGLMKMNSTWLSGRHLYVRMQYLRTGLGWHFPGVMNRCADSLTCDATLATLGIAGELTLAALLVFRPRRWLVTPLVVGIHTFGAFATNVWFFGPSLIAQVFFLSAPSRHKALPP